MIARVHTYRVKRTGPVLFWAEVRAVNATEAIRKARELFAEDAKRATCKAEKVRSDVRL